MSGVHEELKVPGIAKVLLFTMLLLSERFSPRFLPSRNFCGFIGNSVPDSLALLSQPIVRYCSCYSENFKLPAILKEFDGSISLATYVRSHTHLFL
jgi:hypothetical protein